MSTRYTHYGKRELILLLSITVLAVIVFWLLFPDLSLTWRIIGSVVLTSAGFIMSLFFRDPVRAIPPGEDMILSPADGRVVDIQEILPGSMPHFESEGAVRIGIFLSLFNVHINRAPCTLKVHDTAYRRGRHFDARDPISSSENESCTVYAYAVSGPGRFPLAVKQISGAVARRIVCDTFPGETLRKGQPYGMIKFGSRTELFIPVRYLDTILVKVGDKVKAGVSPMAYAK